MVDGEQQPAGDSVPPAGPPALRASDADRERVIEALRRHTAAGRLDADELEQRLTGTLNAKTVDDLAALTADLPVLRDEDPPARRPDAEAREELKAQLWQKGGGAAAISLLCVIIWLATGADGHFWPIWVIVGTGAGVVGTSWRGLGPGGDPRSELERLREERRHRGRALHGGHALGPGRHGHHRRDRHRGRRR
ncbi:DUF1707 SHOCT-like domain-containing protein [Patulibacter defluvii]|uniref:DUF1707 SHOCT-like domain-containing protein n=1 Tax=Patulibacter defluvii TaxID=3095358 RepID=UPI002A74B2D4|nr:DUF1707 domain-containing protein [Patulibacter sp. DM4]